MKSNEVLADELNAILIALSGVKQEMANKGDMFIYLQLAEAGNSISCVKD